MHTDGNDTFSLDPQLGHGRRLLSNKVFVVPTSRITLELGGFIPAGDNDVLDGAVKTEDAPPPPIVLTSSPVATGVAGTASGKGVSVSVALGFFPLFRVDIFSVEPGRDQPSSATESFCSEVIDGLHLARLALSWSVIAEIVEL